MRCGFFELCIRKVGRVIMVVYCFKFGDIVFVCGFYGNGFLVDEWEGMDFFFIVVGFGIVLFRSVFLYVMDNCWKYGNIIFINMVRYGKDFFFYKEFEVMKDLVEVENVKII